MAVRFGIIFITDDKTEELRSILERKKKLNLIFIKKLITKIAFWDYLTC
ncbi:hypothetical protein Hpoki265_11890 [Helicobacter pylori]